MSAVIIDFNKFCEYRNKKTLAKAKVDPISVALAELSEAITDINVRWAKNFMTIWGFGPPPSTKRINRNDDMG